MLGPCRSQLQTLVLQLPHVHGTGTHGTGTNDATVIQQIADLHTDNQLRSRARNHKLQQMGARLAGCLAVAAPAIPIPPQQRPSSFRNFMRRTCRARLQWHNSKRRKRSEAAGGGGDGCAGNLTERKVGVGHGCCGCSVTGCEEAARSEPSMCAVPSLPCLLTNE